MRHYQEIINSYAECASAKYQVELQLEAEQTSVNELSLHSQDLAQEVERLKIELGDLCQDEHLEIQQLRTALEEYGVHKMNCASLLPVGLAVDEKQDCDCGYEQVLEGGE